MRYSLAMTFVLFAAAFLSAANAERPPSSGVESLGDELLNDLRPDVLDTPQTQSNGDANIRQTMPRDPTTRGIRFDDLGEDIGQPSGALSLVRVQRGMQHAESLLTGKKAAADRGNLQQAGAAQQQVVAQLDELIAELSKQCKGGQCQPSEQPPKVSQRSQKKPSKSGGAAGKGQTAARDSTDRLDSASAKPVDRSEVGTMVKDLWGHLPDRSREQMMQSFSEEFLPKYELEIEQYYRRLSEGNDESRPE